MFQSRWGFHPCDYSTYRKLKFLHRVYFQAVRMARAWERWKRKDPHNRVLRRRIRNDRGQVIGYESPVPIAEPRLCALFTKKVLATRHVDKKGNVFRDGFQEERLVTDDPGIAGDFAAARRPVKEASEVRVLCLTVEVIDHLYEQAQHWIEEQAVN